MPVCKNVNKNFFKTWSPDMAYVLGFFTADGNMVKTKRNTHFIAFYSADRILIQFIKRAFSASHKISERKSVSGVVYRLQLGSKELFQDLLVLGLYPNKSRRLKLPNVPTRYAPDFIRGYFDGDGNVWSGITNKHRTKPTKILQVAFTSASIGFLGSLKNTLKQCGIKGGSLYMNHEQTYGRLLFSTLDALKIYKIMYNAPCKPCLKRKKLVFEKFIKVRV